jgi:2-oxoglutarate dehydrogenase E1 component
MAASTTTGQTIDVVTPAAGESVTEGTILEWRVKVGDAIKRDDTIVDISTDKVDVELPSPASGTVSEILVQEGDTVTVGQVIARIVIGDGSPQTTAGNGAAANGGASTSVVPSGPPASPVATRVAAAEGVDLNTVSGSGPAGRIMKADVLDAASDNGAATAPAGAQLMKGGAAALARYMEASRAIPTATSFRTLTVTALDARRRELKTAGQRVSFTH